MESELFKIAEKFGIKIVSIADLIEYRIKHEKLIERLISVNMPTVYGDFELIAFHDKTREETHLALKKGDWKEDEPVLVRVHSSCQTGDILGSLRCDCGPQLHAALSKINEKYMYVALSPISTRPL